VTSQGRGDEIGSTRRGKGLKIIAIVDRHGLPLAVTTHAASHQEVTLVQLTFDFYMIEAEPGNLIGRQRHDVLMVMPPEERGGNSGASANGEWVLSAPLRFQVRA